jgi:hypothetical protein
MKTLAHYRHRLRMKNGDIDSIEFEGKVVNTFKKPVTNRCVPKLYVVKHQSKIVYIGFTSQGIRTRLRQGLKAKGEHGYHGYQWKDRGEVDLWVWCFPEKLPERVESIEAELVYLVRNQTGQWPECQTEIHFHKVSEEEKRVAKSIYQALE